MELGICLTIPDILYKGQHVFDYDALEADICNYSVGLRIKPCPVEHVSDCTELKIYDNAYIRAQ